MAISSFSTDSIVGAPVYAYPGYRFSDCRKMRRGASSRLAKFEGYRIGYFRDERRLGCLPIGPGSGDCSRPSPDRPGKQNHILMMIIALAASLVLSRHLLTLMSNI